MRVARAVAILMAIMFMMTAASGCGDIDWKDSAKRVAIEWIKGQVIVAIDKYDNREGKEEAVAWIVENIKNVDALDSVTKWMPLEELAGAAWDYTLMKIYRVARAKGMDLDADEPEPYAWHVSGGDFAGVDSELMALMD